MPEHRLDLAGLKCPLPVLKTRKALSSLNVGDVLVAACTDPMADIDIPDLVAGMGAVLLGKEKTSSHTIFRIEKR